MLFEGKPDARTKVVKELKKFCVAEEMGFIKPDQAAGIMAQILGERGKRFEPEAREYLGRSPVHMGKGFPGLFLRSRLKKST